MGKWGVIVPVAAVNYITNPTFYYNNDDWTEYTTDTATGLLIRQVSNAMKGYYSVLVAKGSLANTGNYGHEYSVPGFADFDSGDVLALSAFVYQTAGSYLTLEVEVTYAVGSDTFSVDVDGAYRGRVSVVGTLTANATAMTVRAYVPDDRDGGFSITGVQLELDQLTTYFDGDVGGCSWSGERHDSHSIRPATLRVGGIETDFNDYGFYVTDHTGMYSAAVGNDVRENASLAGGWVANSRSPVRRGSLAGDLVGTSLVDLLSKRKALIDLLSSRGDNREATIYYEGGNTRLYLDVVLDENLSGFNPEGFSERIALRFVSPNPHWYKGYQTSFTLDGYDLNSGYYLFAQFVDGEWTMHGSVVAAPTVDVIVNHNGRVYIGGSFGNVDSVADTANFCRYDPADGSFSSLGVVNGRVRAMDHHVDNTIFIGGDFTSCGGVANTAYTARWLEDTSLFAPLLVTANATCYAIKVGRKLGLFPSASTIVYVAGNFTAPENRIATYGLAGEAIDPLHATIDPPAAVRCLDIREGNLYLGGDFANIDGDTDMSYIAQWDGTDYLPMGTGADDSVHTLLCHSDGSVYAGGEFTTMSGGAMALLAQWDGNTWNKVGPSDYIFGGTSPIVRKLIELPNGEVVIGGDFNSYWGNRAPLNDLVFWDGNTYYFEMRSSDVYVLHYDQQMGLCVGTDATATATPHLNVVNNTGNVDVSPTFRLINLDTSYLAGQSQVLRNITNGTRLDYLRYLMRQEEVVFGMSDGGFVVRSSISRNVLPYMLPNSDFGNFKLVPGNNNVSYYAGHGNADADVALYWVDLFWGPDGD